MIIHTFELLFSLMVVIYCAHGDQVDLKNNKSVLFKRNIIDTSRNNISKLRLILMNDLKKQNEIVSNLKKESDPSSTKMLIKL